MLMVVNHNDRSQVKLLLYMYKCTKLGLAYPVDRNAKGNGKFLHDGDNHTHCREQILKNDMLGGREIERVGRREGEGGRKCGKER